MLDEFKYYTNHPEYPWSDIPALVESDPRSAHDGERQPEADADHDRQARGQAGAATKPEHGGGGDEEAAEAGDHDRPARVVAASASATASDCCSATANCDSCGQADEASKVALEVPEIGSQEIAGEWLIPNDGILLVSFGPHTVADKDGKAVVRERLAIVEAMESSQSPAMPSFCRITRSPRRS